MNNALIYITAGAVFDSFADLLMKNWVVSSNIIHFAGGMLFYIIGLSFLTYSFTFKNIIVASVIFLIFNIALLSLVNWIVYNVSLRKRTYSLGFGVGLDYII